MPVLEHIITWNSAQRIQRLIRRIQKQYVGMRVTELMPNGSKLDGVIVEMSWEGSIGLEGKWCVKVQFDAWQYPSWTDCDRLELTGAK
jgi:hypothetical protein